MNTLRIPCRGFQAVTVVAGLDSGSAQRLPHRPYVQAVDEALTARGIPPGTVRADRTYAVRGNRMYIVLVWDVSRTLGAGGLRFNWEEETGWAYALLGVGPSLATPAQPLTALHRVFAARRATLRRWPSTS